MNRAEIESLDRAGLVEVVLRQAARIAESDRRQAESDRRIDDLVGQQAELLGRLAEFERRFAELERQSMRSAAPFARPQDKRATSPKPPGRKGGHEGSFMVRPPEEAVDRRIDVPLTHCPR